MSRGRNDDVQLENAKWRLLERDARLWADGIALWNACTQYANRASTDGLVERARLVKLTPMKDARVIAVAEALCDTVPEGKEHGLFERRPNGDYYIHDFLKFNKSRAQKEHEDAEKEASKEADRLRKQRERAEAKAAVSGEMSGRTNAGRPSGQASDVQSDVRGLSGGLSEDRPRAGARGRAGALARAPDPVPSRPVPTTSAEKISNGEIFDTRSGEQASPLERVIGGFARRYNAKTDPAGKPLGAGWMGVGQHRGAADRVADLYANRLDELEASLDGYFASVDPFVVKQARWNFATWVADPGKWASARVEPEVDMAALTARIPRAVIDADRDDEMVLPPRRRA